MIKNILSLAGAWLLLCSIASASLAPDNAPINKACHAGTGSCSRLLKSCDAKTINTRLKTTDKALTSQMPSAGIHWQEYSPGVFEQAKKNHRLTILFGKTDLCHWSQKMEAVTFQDPSIVKVINDNYTPIFFDFNKNNALAMHYQIIYLPTTIILDSDGKLIKVFSGYVDPKVLSKSLQQFTAMYLNK